jgi:hypothetical protein
MTTLPVNFETFKVSGITDITQIQNITDITQIQNIIDMKGNLLNISLCYSDQSKFKVLNITDLNITDPKGNIIELK